MLENWKFLREIPASWGWGVKYQSSYYYYCSYLEKTSHVTWGISPSPPLPLPPQFPSIQKGQLRMQWQHALQMQTINSVMDKSLCCQPCCLTNVLFTPTQLWSKLLHGKLYIIYKGRPLSKYSEEKGTVILARWPSAAQGFWVVGWIWLVWWMRLCKTSRSS